MPLTRQTHFIDGTLLLDAFSFSLLIGDDFRATPLGFSPREIKGFLGKRDLALEFDDLEGTLTLDLELALGAFPLDPRFLQCEAEGDLFTFRLLARFHFRFVERPAAGDLMPLRLFLGTDSRFGESTLLCEPCHLHRLTGDELRLFGFLITRRALFDEHG
ncbi:MAG: hypothetical protein LGL72_07400, partial [Acidibrevibacterium sp.]|uniref:hypothetical protein n=1 Tax=Acidibrevibacterium fodinaquatile TaxID=1969806 RepID=UPI0023A85EEF